MTVDATTAAAIPELLGLVKKTWGYADLRPLQREAMVAILDKRDSVVVMPTGGGKSLCYQAPAVYLSGLGHGPTVVVSPLIALMKDQVDSLRALGIPAAQLDSSLSADQRRVVSQDLRSGRLAMLFVSPERLVGSLAPTVDPEPEDECNSGATVNPMLAMLQQAGVRTFAIDEAHCISHWGHDFRPEYRRLAMLKSFFPGCSVHAFTATATEQVRHDIATQLQLENPARLVGNFDRPNLVYRVLPRRDVIGQIREVLARHAGEAGIIYCLRRRDVDETVAAIKALNKTSGHRAMGYHAGMTPDVRRSVQEAFAQEQCDLIVATVAFGMGIDRSNIRFVLHAGMPKSIEAYQQETGRAGRDGLEAECVLLYSGQDVMTLKSLIERSADDAETRGIAVSPDYIPTAMRHLDDMDRFARGAVCRHKALVEYFGQTYQPPPEDDAGTEAAPELAAKAAIAIDPPVGGGLSCRACDHCLGDTESVPDALVIAQKILSAVARTEQRFGAGQIIAVLRGENNAKVRQFQHDTLSVHGLLKGHSAADIRNFIYQLIGQGVLAQENLILPDGHAVPIIKLNQASVEVMKGLRSVRLIQLAQKPSEDRAGLEKREISWQGVDRGLFEELRGLRRTLAAERKVPPHIIYSDATLRELARVRPVGLENFRNIYGIGEAKLRDFGKKTIAFIADYSTAHLLPTNVQDAIPLPAGPPVGPTISRPNVTKSLAMSLFGTGHTIAQVSQQTGRAASTIAEYLVEYILVARPHSIAVWVPEQVYRRVAAAINKLGDQRLKPIFTALNETVSYDQIRLVVTHLQCGKAKHNPKTVQPEPGKKYR